MAAQNTPTPAPEAPKGGRLLASHPRLNLALCAVFVYAGILFAMLGTRAAIKLNFFAAAALSFIAAYHLFRNFQKARRAKV